MPKTSYTVFCKAPSDARGQYSEEIDVQVSRRSQTAALKAAQVVLDRDHAPGMRAVRAEECPGGFGWLR